MCCNHHAILENTESSFVMYLNNEFKVWLVGVAISLPGKVNNHLSFLCAGVLCVHTSAVSLTRY